MTKLIHESIGLSPPLAEKNERLVGDIRKLHLLRYGDPENGQISARRRPSRGELNAAAAKLDRFYQAHRKEFHEQALLEDALHEAQK